MGLLTRQATNSLKLYKGNNVATIKTALKMQKPSVVKELMDYFKVSNLDALANKLA